MTRAASTKRETAHETVPIYGLEPPLARGKAVSSTPEASAARRLRSDRECMGENTGGSRAAITLFPGSWWNCREIAGVLFDRILDIGMRLEKRGELGVLR